jgi:hypothetical protein
VRPTILLDEVDAIFGSYASKDHEDLRRSSTPDTGPGAAVLRVIGDGGNMRAHEFKAYCPVALAGQHADHDRQPIDHYRDAPEGARRASACPFRGAPPGPRARPCAADSPPVSRHGDDIPEAPRQLA